MIGGGLRALRQTDLKLLLAMGTVSQLGFMIAVFGLGLRRGRRSAGCAVLLAHGAVQGRRVHGRRHRRPPARHPRPPPAAPARHRVGGSRRVVTVVAAASMAGVPLMFGFIAKEAVFEAFVHEDGAWCGASRSRPRSLGSVLTRRLQPALHDGRARTPLDVAATVVAADRPRTDHRRRRSSRPPSCSPPSPCCSASCPGCSTALVGAAADAPRPGRRRRPPRALARVQPAARAVGDRARRRHRAVRATGRAVDPLVARYRSRVRSRRATSTAASLRGLNTRGEPRRRPSCSRARCPIYLGVILLTAAVIPGAAAAHRRRGGPAGPSSSTTPVARPDRGGASSAPRSRRRSCTAASPRRCSSAWSATRWPGCS